MWCFNLVFTGHTDEIVSKPEEKLISAIRNTWCLPF